MQQWQINGRTLEVTEETKKTLEEFTNGAPSAKLRNRIQRLVFYLVFNSIVQYVAFHWKWIVIGNAGLVIKPLDALILGWLHCMGGSRSAHGAYLLMGMLGRLSLLLFFVVGGEGIRERWLYPHIEYINPHVTYAAVTILGSMWEVISGLLQHRRKRNRTAKVIQRDKTKLE